MYFSLVCQTFQILSLSALDNTWGSYNYITWRSLKYRCHERRYLGRSVSPRISRYTEQAADHDLESHTTEQVALPQVRKFVAVCDLNKRRSVTELVPRYISIHYFCSYLVPKWTYFYPCTATQQGSTSQDWSKPDPCFPPTTTAEISEKVFRRSINTKKRGI